MDTKRCADCERTLPLVAFNVNRARKDGLDAKCRTCRSEWKAYNGWGRKDLPHLSLEPTIAGYLAGLIDGEGTIRLASIRKQLTSYCFITNTHRGVLDWVAEILGFGHVVVSHRPVNRRICYRWGVTGHNARRLLRAVAPFLIIKRRHADLMLAFYGQRQAYKERLPVGHRALHCETLQEPLLGIYEELRSLNRRGPHLS